MARDTMARDAVARDAVASGTIVLNVHPYVPENPMCRNDFIV
jgi:hypothetical protein